MKTSDIVIVGSGSLAGRIVNILSVLPMKSLRIALIGRSITKISRLAAIANARASCYQNSLTFQPIELTECRASVLSRTFHSLKPKVILHAASIQSPWESCAGQNAWTRLVTSAGFAITLPLQLALVSEVCRAAEDTKAAIINACYPDVVNLVLHRLGLPVTCGLGNAGIVEAFCRSHTKAFGKEVRVVGHHGHLTGWLRAISSRTQPRVWLNGKETETTSWHPNLVSVAEELNDVTSATAVAVLIALLTGASLHISIPGVDGLPGGYPFALKRGKFTLRLPRGISLAEAIDHNKTGEQLDGLDLQSGVQFVDNTSRHLSSVGFEFPQGFNFDEWPKACERMLALRERLRLQPA